MTQYYYNDSRFRTYETTTYTGTTTWTISPCPPRKSKKPNDDFPEENAKLDNFLKTFAKE